MKAPLALLVLGQQRGRGAAVSVAAAASTASRPFCGGLFSSSTAARTSVSLAATAKSTASSAVIGISNSASTSSSTIDSKKVIIEKDIWFLRHGQAMHNPRAEAAREGGCSHEEFLELMRQDDCLDAPLTTLGIQQALDVGRYCRNTLGWFGGRKSDGTVSKSDSVSITPSMATKEPQCIVSSPLSRALQTAQVLLWGSETAASNSIGNHSSNNNSSYIPRLVCYEGFREINGWLLNAQRQRKSVLQRTFAAWNFDTILTEDDVDWDATVLEDKAVCGQRGVDGLHWLLSTTHCPESSILVVAHGAILHALLEHADIQVLDKRHMSAAAAATTTTLDPANDSPPHKHRSVFQRYGNCELRRYRLQAYTTATTTTTTTSAAATTDQAAKGDITATVNDSTSRVQIVLTEVDL